MKKLDASTHLFVLRYAHFSLWINSFSSVLCVGLLQTLLRRLTNLFCAEWYLISAYTDLRNYQSSSFIIYRYVALRDGNTVAASQLNTVIIVAVQQAFVTRNVSVLLAVTIFQKCFLKISKCVSDAFTHTEYNKVVHYFVNILHWHKKKML